jgi:predicted nucleic acid-binding protein
VIVLDTSILSLAFRRRPTGVVPRSVERLLRLVEADAPLRIPGIVAQELLSGVRSHGDFTRLERLVAPFPKLIAAYEHHVAAAEISNACRARGISPSGVDCLIAAQAIAIDGALFTADTDFIALTRHSALRLFDVDRD